MERAKMSLRNRGAMALLIGLCLGLPVVAQTADAPLSPAATVDMASIEAAWTRGDYVFVREGLKSLAETTAQPLAQYRYGRVLIEGRGGPQNLAEGVAWLERAVAQNQIDATTLLAQVLISEDLPGVTSDPARAIELYELAAARGHAPAQYDLARLAQTGRGMKADPQQAFRWYLAAAEQGHAKAQLALAKLYSQGQGTAVNASESQRWLLEAAEAGETEAQYFLALRYETGDSVPANPNEALRWYRRAAEAGLPIAQRSLGNLYLLGKDVEANPAEALRWLEAAANAGDPGAMANLGMAYANGEGVPKNEALGYSWYVRAAKTGLPRAVTSLARMTELGSGTKADLDQAISLYRQAAESGDRVAMARLGELAADNALDGKLAPQRAVPWAAVAAENGYAPARDWLERQATGGLREAMASLALVMLQSPDQSVPDQTKAVEWLTAAAEAGEVQAQARLGNAFAAGELGLAQDYVAAHSWLNLAAGAGDGEAEKMRDVIAALMTPEQIAEAQGKARQLFDAINARVPQTVQTVVTP